jgi:hypothetical protein
MARKKPQGKVGEPKYEIVAELPLASSNEDAAVEFMESNVGADPSCPRCGLTNV